MDEQATRAKPRDPEATEDLFWVISSDSMEGPSEAQSLVMNASLVIWSFHKCPVLWPGMQGLSLSSQYAPESEQLPPRLSCMIVS